MATHEAEHVRPLSEVLKTLELLEGKEDMGWVLCEEDRGMQVAARVRNGRIETVWYREGVSVNGEVMAIKIQGLGVARYVKVKDSSSARKDDWECELRSIQTDDFEIPYRGGVEMHIRVLGGDSNRLYQFKSSSRASMGQFFERVVEGESVDHYFPIHCTVEHSPIQIGDRREC